MTRFIAVAQARTSGAVRTWRTATASTADGSDVLVPLGGHHLMAANDFPSPPAGSRVGVADRASDAEGALDAAGGGNTIRRAGGDERSTDVTAARAARSAYSADRFRPAISFSRSLRILPDLPDILPAVVAVFAVLLPVIPGPGGGGPSEPLPEEGGSSKSFRTRPDLALPRPPDRPFQ